MFGFQSGWMARIPVGFSRFIFVALIGIAGVCFSWVGTASAQDRRQNTPGEFDFYVLSLSWSPSFCEEASERGSSGVHKPSAGHGHFPSWSMACGRNTNMAFPIIASGPRRGSIATSCRRCWI